MSEERPDTVILPSYFPAEVGTWIDDRAAKRGTTRGEELDRIFEEWLAAGGPNAGVPEELLSKVGREHLAVIRAVMWAAARDTTPLAMGKVQAKA